MSSLRMNPSPLVLSSDHAPIDRPQRVPSFTTLSYVGTTLLRMARSSSWDMQRRQTRPGVYVLSENCISPIATEVEIFLCFQA